MIRIAALPRYEDAGKNRRRIQETFAPAPGCVSVALYSIHSQLRLYRCR